MAPAPISWPPSQYWDGDDGSWSSFGLRVGDPGQTVRVLPSTAGQATLVVIPEGCPPGRSGTDTSLTCDYSRGGMFNRSQSKTWDALGNYSMGLEASLGYGDLSATYGLDMVALGFSDSIGGPTLESQVVGGLETDDYYMGMFGLNDQGTNLTNLTDTHQSFLTTMKMKDLIPSRSWAYTAGAPYRLKGMFGSLTFGGYDDSRFIPNNVSLSLAPDITRDLVVGLKSITSTTLNSSEHQSLLPTPILTFIDSTLPFIYLPLEACKVFESTFGLTWNDTAQTYWINETVHQNLLSMSPNITFTIGDSTAAGPTVDIILPYPSFDLEAKPPSVVNSSRYFPLQRADNETQYTLGRTFLQETYLITDYEHANFSISQCKFEEGLPPNIIAIPSTDKTPDYWTHKVIIGTSIGATTFLLLVVFALALAIRRRRRSLPKRDSNDAPEMSAPSQEPKTMTFYSVREMDANSTCGPIRELPDNGKVELLDEHSPSGSGNEIQEMSESLPPVVHELRTNRSSKEQSIIQLQTTNRYKIFMATRISTKSLTSLGSSDTTPCVETVIRASTRHNSLDMDRSSLGPSKAEEIYSCYLRKPLDLDRSLPPTPISESPQISPIVAKFNRGSSFRRRPETSKGLARLSLSAFILSKAPIYRRSEALIRRDRLLLSSSLTGLETVIPPGQPSPESEISISPEEEQISDKTWL